jgi:tetratricopeptide (TPR) repeat protein
MQVFSRIMLGALVLVLVSGGLRADDLVLVDGRYLQVKFIKGEERGVHVKLLDTGGEILIPWNLIREGDRERLMRMFGLIEDASDIPMEKGVRIVAKSGDFFLGVPLTEIPEGQIPDEITLWIEGRKTPFKKEHIRSLEPTMVPSIEAFSREQLYDRQFSQFPPGEDDLEGHWDLSRYCVSINFYEKALEHLHKVAELDPQYRPDYVANQIARLEELRKSEKIMEQLRLAMRKAFHNQFSVALSTIDQLLSIKEMDPNIQMEIEMKQTKIQAMRLKYYTRVVTRNYHRLLELKLRKMSADKDLKLNQAKRELRRNVHKEIVADISSKHGLDQKEVQKMWEERKVFSFRTASYGSGTFIVLGKKKGMERLNQQVENAIRRAQGRQQGRGGRNNQNSFNNTMQRLPKPPTPDEWWRKSDASSRKNWMKAYYAENAGQMKDLSERKAGCGSCGSTGTRKFAGAQGETLKVTCPRCHGHKHDRRVAYK